VWGKNPGPFYFLEWGPIGLLKEFPSLNKFQNLYSPRNRNFFPQLLEKGFGGLNFLETEEKKRAPFFFWPKNFTPCGSPRRVLKRALPLFWGHYFPKVFKPLKAPFFRVFKHVFIIFPSPEKCGP